MVDLTHAEIRESKDKLSVNMDTDIGAGSQAMQSLPVPPSCYACAP